MKPVIFWDFDGTLVYSNQSFLQSLTGAMEEAGQAGDPEACREFLSRACSWNHPEISFENRTGPLWWEDLLEKTREFLRSREIPAEICRDICLDFHRRAAAYPYRLYGDAREILAWTADRGYRNCILSSNFPELRERVEELGLGQSVEQCFLSSEIGFEKPRRELFAYALSRTGEPRDCWMVGDNPRADIAGAAGAGIRTVLVHREDPEGLADWVCRELTELKTIF